MSPSNLIRSIQTASYEGRDIGHHSGLYTLPNSMDFDYAIADLNVPMAGLDLALTTSYDSLENYNGEAENTPFEDFSLDNGDFEVEVLPEENFMVMQNIAEQVPLYVPDHVMECLPKGLERRFEGTGHYNEAEEIHRGIFDFLNTYADPLPVREKMGLDKYTKKGLRNKHGDMTEDDFIVEVCQELNGDGVVMTYDADYLSYEVEAAAPKAVEHVLKSD